MKRLLLLLLFALPVGADNADSTLSRVSLTPQLNQSITPTLNVVTATGETVAIGRYLDRPALLVLVYYNCPSLCGLLLEGLQRSLQRLDSPPGTYAVLAVSIDPREGPADAAAAQQRLWGKPADHWHFLTAEQSVIQTLAAEAGIGYAYDDELQQYAHPAVITVLTREGRIARYLSGVAYPPETLRLALLEAGEGRIGTPLERVLLRCYRYDPVTGRYTLSVMALLRWSGLATLLVLGTAIAWLLLRRRSGP